jgi:ribose 5-phosphate isomerase
MLGVVETGIFASMADIVYLGTHSAVERIERKLT